VGEIEREIERIKNEITKLIEDYEKSHLIFVSEADAVTTLAEKLKKNLNEIVPISAEAFAKVPKKFVAVRVHLEVDALGTKKGKGRPLKVMFRFKK
jgi:hypothetical protein